MHGPALFVTGLLATGAIASPWGRPEWATDIEEGRPEWTAVPSWWGEGHDPEHRRPTTTSDAVAENTAAATSDDAGTTAVVKNVTPVAPEHTTASHNATRGHHSHHSHATAHNGTAHNATRAATTLQTMPSHTTTHVPFVLSSLISDAFMATHKPSPIPTTTPTQQPTSQQPKAQQPHSSQKSAEQKPSATTAGSSSTGSSTGSSNGAKASTYQQAVIAHHNYHRANHSSPDIAWDDKLASSAAKIAATCKFAHSMNVDGGGYGQNIAAGVGPEKISDVITGMFYNGEVNHFNYYGTENPPNFETWGHFSQVVWKDTTHVACATQDCRSAKGKIAGADVDSYFTVCNYGPAGNMGGTYVKNIGKSLGKPTITWTEGLADNLLKAAQN